MVRTAFGLLVVSLMMVAPAWAQSGTGVSVALVGDIVRHDGASGDVFGGGSRDGEALGFSLRLDRALGARWGVELEYLRGGEIESESRVVPLPTAELLTSLSSTAAFSFVSSSSLIFPRESRTIVSDRLSTISTLLWYRQSVGERTSLVYSAGMAFGIGRTESTYTILGLPDQNTIAPITSEYTSYSVNPLVGIDARIAMTEHAALVPGVRLLGANGGIIMRPSIGLRWQF